MKIEDYVKELLFKYPLFGNVIANLEFKLTNSSVPAPAYTDGINVYYKQELLDKYDDNDIVFIFAHEIFHIVLKHMFRNEGRNKDLLNYVEDGIINQLLERDGLSIPDGAVIISDALDYSVEELYMKYLPYIKEIESWMTSNTYHVQLDAGTFNLKISAKDLMGENNALREDLLKDFKKNLYGKCQAECASLGIETEEMKVGKSFAILSWKDILKATLVSKVEKTPSSFYEVEMDGVIKKEEKYDADKSETEIVIDSSASMGLTLIKAILRECKNILDVSEVKVGFCDVKFYGWHTITSEDEIDSLRVKGFFGTSFLAMANNFTDTVENKIVITDGEGYFPYNRSDVLWIIITRHLNCLKEELSNRDDVNYIILDENEVIRSEYAKKYIKKQTRVI